jgi:hypothetical protein
MLRRALGCIEQEGHISVAVHDLSDLPDRVIQVGCGGEREACGGPRVIDKGYSVSGSAETFPEKPFDSRQFSREDVLGCIASETNKVKLWTAFPTWR